MRKTKTMAALLSIVFLVSTFFAGTVSADEEQGGVESFVTRLYSICLDRTPDEQGLAGWSDALRSGRSTGVEVAYGFIFSGEFQGKAYDNETYVEKMYNAFLGRSSDAQGRAAWVEQMESGLSRQELFAGFANSNEFGAICQSYGIERGTYTVEGGASQPSVNMQKVNEFVSRLYSVCLGRTPDSEGLAAWANKLANREITGTQAAEGFFYSNEYRNKNRSNEEFVTDLYTCFLGRTPDAAGKAAWVNQLDSGVSDTEIFNGFSQSSEYDQICSSYGIERGGAITNEGSCRAVMPSSSAVTTTPTTPTPTPTTVPSSGSSSNGFDSLSTTEGTGPMVWVSSNGNRYHSRSTCSNMIDPIQVHLSEALRIGRSECHRCY